ncbi:ATP synthase F0 subunit B [Boudabousia tangfeifanii]|uniref:ATP synthase subunit b n=1 Tax=Boudabousia tangfeifanii TaxID=1912795 RepID=A0A1D9MJN3_9ACTO|nr:F0F1 ATP synthase subunit B [Boudabousia tangfeifanii]AOZ72504.1 ATP synthase F0 subunit B [Boudabousia tangfeifanii]
MILRTLVIPAAADHNPMLPHLYDLVWGTIAFALVAAVFLLYVLPRFNKVLDERTETIEAGIENAKAAEVALSRAKHDADQERQKALDEAAKIREEATEQARRIVAQAKNDASLEAARLYENAKAQISAERQSAQVALRQDVGSLATELAEKLIGEHLSDQALTDRVIDRFMNDLENEMAKQEA